MKSRERHQCWVKAMARKNEVIRLGKHRAGRGETTDTRRAVLLLAVTLGSAPAGRYKIKNRFVISHGLDRVTLATAVREGHLAEIGCDDDLIDWALDRAKLDTSISQEKAGEMLSLTAEERELLSIRSMEAIDESRADRQSREREQRKVQNKGRKRAKRQKEIEDGIRVSRADYLVQFAVEGEPWLDLNISREAWRKRQLRAQAKALPEAGAAPSDDLSGVASASPYDLSGVTSVSGVTSADPCILRASGRHPGQTEDAASAPLEPPVVEHVPDATRGLGDGSRSPKSGSEKKETEGLGRAKQEEADPQPTFQDVAATRVRDWTAREAPRVRAFRGFSFGDYVELDAVVLAIGDGDYQRGLALMTRLGDRQLAALADDVSERGAERCADEIALARTTALRNERLMSTTAMMSARVSR